MNDLREPSTIINALDASAVADTLFRKNADPTLYDPKLDFNRDGQVDEADLVLLQTNYLKFSPILVPGP